MKVNGSISTKTLILSSLLVISVTATAVALTVISKTKFFDSRVIPLSENRAFINNLKKLEHQRSGLPEHCVQDYFWDIKLEKPDGYRPYGGIYRPISIQNINPVRGCLWVNWYKKSNNDIEGWWKGEIKWQWVLSAGNEGFIFSGESKNSIEQKEKLDLNIKLLGVRLVDDKWETKFYKDFKYKNIGRNDDWNKFPKGFQKDEYKEGHAEIDKDLRSWGFAPWYDRSCKWEDPNEEDLCKIEFDNKTIKFNKRWNWEGSHNIHRRDRFSDMHSNFEYLWRDYEKYVNLKDQINGNGTWK